MLVYCIVILSLENFGTAFSQSSIMAHRRFQSKDLRHPDDTSLRVTADHVNSATNPECVNKKKTKIKQFKKKAVHQQREKCLVKTRVCVG